MELLELPFQGPQVLRSACDVETKPTILFYFLISRAHLYLGGGHPSQKCSGLTPGSVFRNQLL